MMTFYPTVKVKLDEGAMLPDRAHDTDAGADIYSPETFILMPHSSEIIHTGVHVELPPNTVGMLKSKSGLNVNHDIIGESVIDEGYDGEIVVKLYNLGYAAHRFDRGDKLIQLCVMPVCYPTYQQTDEIKAGDRGSDGFGSTSIFGGERL